MGSFSFELEYCTSCKKETGHYVDHTTKADGAPWRKGECCECFCKRALPLTPIESAEDSCFFFGKYKEVPFKEVPSGYLQWAIKNVDLNSATRRRVEKVLENRKS